MREIFGTQSDYGDRIMKLMDWHNSREWNFQSLTEMDAIKAAALSGMTDGTPKKGTVSLVQK